MSSQPLGDRSNYQRGRLDANDLLPDPVDQFHRWVNEAIAQQVPEPLAAALATADDAGNPSVRMILIRGIGPAGIDFYTNHGSRKGRTCRSRVGHQRVRAAAGLAARSRPLRLPWFV